MTQQQKVWYYASEGQQFGPYSGNDLRAIAQSGKITPTDLIWKEGLANWLPASSVKGLIPAAASVSPPPLPSPPTSKAISLADARTSAPQGANTIGKPAFWNPLALSNWSFFFTPIFGAYLVAENYKAMGRPVDAKKSMDWLYITAAIMLSVFLLVPALGASGFGAYFLAYLANFFIWNFRSARKQSTIIVSEYGKNYERQPWGKVLVIGMTGSIVWQLIVALFL